MVVIQVSQTEVNLLPTFESAEKTNYHVLKIFNFLHLIKWLRKLGCLQFTMECSSNVGFRLTEFGFTLMI